MRFKVYYITVSVIFSTIAVVHFVRAYFGWEIMVADAVIPVWISWAAAAIAGYLAVRGFQVARECEEKKHWFSFW